MTENVSAGRSAARPRRWRARRLARAARAARSVIRTKIVTTFYRRMVLLTYELQGRRIPAFSSRIPVRYGTLTDADLGAYRRFRPKLGRRELEHRLRRGDRCFVVWHEGRIVHECWVTTAPTAYVAYLHREIRLEPGDAYYYGAYTDAGFRGLGLFTGCYSFIARTLQREGCRRSIALVAVENRRSVLVLERSGLTPGGLYACLRLGPWRRHRAWPFPGRTLPPLQRPRSEPAGALPRRPVAWT